MDGVYYSPAESSLSSPVGGERPTSTTPSGGSSDVAVGGQRAVENGTSDGVATAAAAVPPPPPLSLADIAEVTVPVLDELFPPDSGVQV